MRLRSVRSIAVCLLLALAVTRGIAADELITLDAVRAVRVAAADPEAAAAKMVERWDIDPAAARILAIMPPDQLARYGDAELQALVAALLPRDDQQRLALAPLSYQVGEETSQSLRQGEPVATRLSGGVALQVEHIAVAADALTFIIAPAGATTVLEEAEILPGSAGPVPNRIRIDTRRSRFDSINFRGLLEPRRAVIARHAEDDPERVRWDIAIADPGVFSGLLKQEGGWIPMQARAAAIDARAVADRLDGGLGSPRLETLVLLGSATEPAVLRTRREVMGGLKDVDIRAPRIVVGFDGAGEAYEITAQGANRSDFYPVLPDGTPTAPPLRGQGAP